jgi:hypothetical protein
LATCDAGFANCDDQTENGCETNVQTDPTHCGDCGTKCRFAHASALCNDGTCALGACDAGYDNCDGETENGCESHLSDDLDHCGECDNPCDRDTQICDGGACADCDVCADGCPYTSIQTAIDEAESGDTIRVCAGNWVLTSTIVVDKNLTLIGAGTDETVLDGDTSVRVLQIGDVGLSVQPIVTVRDLTITRGRAEGDNEDEWGGGLFNYGTLTLNHVDVTNNTASDRGGGIFNFGALTLEECRLTKNTAMIGGGIANHLGTVTLQSSSVTDGAASLGGGIYTLGTALDGMVTLIDSSMTNNTANERGGAIYNDRSQLMLQGGSAVTGNFAQTDGAGIHNFQGTVTLETDDIVTDNTLLDGTTVSNCSPVDTIPNCIG